MNVPKTWKFLVRKPKSAYKQLFVKDRWIAARTLYGQTVGDSARTAQEVAEDYHLPLEVVLEAIDYCRDNPPEVREDWEHEQALIHPAGTEDADRARGTAPLKTLQLPSAHEAIS